MNETIGARIRRLRKDTGLSADAVAERIRMSGAYVRDVERDNHAPGFFMAIELAKVFGVSLDYLAGLTEHTNNPYVHR